jgi:predicted DNA-binding protein (MmcQ/YjbR family)
VNPARTLATLPRADLQPNPMQLDPLRRSCAALPGATRDIKWGSDEVYSVGGKMFAVFALPGGKATSLAFKCDPARFLELTDQPGIVPAPYLARAHWVQLRRDATLPAAEVRTLVARSHALVFVKLTRRMQAEITAAAHVPAKARQ